MWATRQAKKNRLGHPADQATDLQSQLYFGKVWPYHTKSKLGIEDDNSI
jgi:hypothetical protein